MKKALGTFAVTMVLLGASPYILAYGTKYVSSVIRLSYKSAKKAVAKRKFNSWIKQSLKDGSLVKIDGILYEAEAGVVEKA